MRRKCRTGGRDDPPRLSRTSAMNFPASTIPFQLPAEDRNASWSAAVLARLVLDADAGLTGIKTATSSESRLSTRGSLLVRTSSTIRRSSGTLLMSIHLRSFAIFRHHPWPDSSVADTEKSEARGYRCRFASVLSPQAWGIMRRRASSTSSRSFGTSGMRNALPSIEVDVVDVACVLGSNSEDRPDPGADKGEVEENHQAAVVPAPA